MFRKYLLIMIVFLLANSLSMADFAIVTNGDFETGDLTGWGGGATIVSDNGPTLSGTSCAEITDGNNLIVSPRISVLPGDIIKAKWDIKNMAGATGDLWGLFRYFDASNSFLGQKGKKFTADSNGTSWETYTTAEVSMPQNAALADVAFFQAGSYTGSYRIDNVQLDVNSIVVPEECTYDFPLYVDNGGAENDTFKWFGWATGSSVDSNEAYCGLKSFRVDGGGEYIITAKYPLDPNHVYSIRQNIKTTSGSTGNVRVLLRVFDEFGFAGQIGTDLPLTNGSWDEPNLVLVKPSDLVDPNVVSPNSLKTMDIWYNTGVSSFTGTAYIDNIRVVDTTAVGDLSGDGNIAYDDLQVLVSEWLSTNFDANSTEPDILIDDFEGYADQTDLETNWFLSAGWYANSGVGTISLLTNPADAHTGSNALRFTYDNTGQAGDDAVWTEFRKEFDSPVDLSAYDEIRIWLNRHPGNSEEQLLYFKIVEDSFAQANLKAQYTLSQADGSSYSPTGWTEWVVNMNDFEYLNGASGPSDLDNVAGMFFGVVGRNSYPGSKGSGTIDFDEITFVDTTLGCGSVDLLQDLEGAGTDADCEVNLKDIAIFAEYWLNSL